MKYSIGGCVLLGLIAALGLSACRSGEQAIAKVNDTPLPREEYYRRLEIVPTPIQIGPNQATTAPAGYTTLVQMIREQVLLQMAREKGVMPTDKQVDERVEREMKNNPQIKQAITEQKVMTLDDFRRQVRVALAQFNLLTRGVTVTEQEVKQFYEQNKQAFYLPKRVQVRFVLVQNPEIRKQIDDDLKRGFSFQSIVQKYSQNPAAGIQAGETTIAIEGPPSARTPEQQAQEMQLRKVLQNAKVGQVTNWIPLGNVAARVEVITAMSGRQQTFEEVKDSIREGLMLQKGREKNKDINAELARAVLNAKVEILSPQWKERYQKDMEQLRKALEEYDKQQKQASR
ncbi:Foldase protein PrsA [bacterium HR15]|nr:Foldase protein PrsA [bacterium HR15]